MTDKGRLFGMFRNPLTRGVSAFNFNVKQDDSAPSAAAYAPCIAGSQVGMVTGQWTENMNRCYTMVTMGRGENQSRCSAHKDKVYTRTSTLLPILGMHRTAVF